MAKLCSWPRVISLLPKPAISWFMGWMGSPSDPRAWSRQVVKRPASRREARMRGIWGRAIRSTAPRSSGLAGAGGGGGGGGVGGGGRRGGGGGLGGGGGGGGGGGCGGGCGRVPRPP